MSSPTVAPPSGGSGGSAGPSAPDARRAKALADYRAVLLRHAEHSTKVSALRRELKTLKKDHDKTEDDLKSLQSVGQIIGEVLRALSPAKYIVKASSGPRYVVGVRGGGESSAPPAAPSSTTPPAETAAATAASSLRLDPSRLKPGTRVTLDMTTLTIMRILDREVDPMVHGMMETTAAGDSLGYADVGGLSDQIRELREVVELPITNPELFERVGIKAPKGVLLYGPPGTGKTLLAKVIAANVDATFLKVVASAIVDKYIGESARVIREMFAFAKDHQPCVVFMDEIDAIGGRRFSEGTSADREIQRTLMELLNQLDGFDDIGKVKLIMATNRPDVLDPALLRPGRLDRKIEIPLPNEQARLDVLKIHAQRITKRGELDYEAVVKLADGFNGADLRNVCTEAGLMAIRDERDYTVQEDYMKAVRKVGEQKKLEGKLDYKAVWKQNE